MNQSERPFRKLACFLAGGVLLGQFSAGGGCLPNDYFAGLGGVVLELAVTTVAAQVLADAITPAEQP